MFCLFMLSTAFAIALLPTTIGEVRKAFRTAANTHTRRRGRLSVILELCLVLVALISYGAGVNLQKRFSEDVLSRQNLKALSKAMLMYCDDWDDTLPLAHNWEDAIANPKYFGSVNIQHYFNCPTAARNGYAINQGLAGRNLNTILYPSTTVLIFETSKTSRNASGSRNDLMPRKHSDQNVAFCDGNVIWLTSYTIKHIRW